MSLVTSERARVAGSELEALGSRSSDSFCQHHTKVVRRQSLQITIHVLNKSNATVRNRVVSGSYSNVAITSLVVSNIDSRVAVLKK